MKNKTLEYFWTKERKSQKASSSSSPLSLSREPPIEEQGEKELFLTPPQNANLYDQSDNEPSLTLSEEVNQECEKEPSFTSPHELNQNEEDAPFEFTETDFDLLPHDPGRRHSLMSYPVNDRDVVRRRYIEKKPCRPILIGDFPQTLQGSKMRRFKAIWYDRFDWLEYSEQNDAAFCFYCYLFKYNSSSPGGDVFVCGGYRNWKKALSRFIRHVGRVGSAHNIAREKYDFFINKRASIIEIVEKVSDDTKSLYKFRLLCSLSCLRFLLKQGLSFRGHDESENSDNRGNFLELLKWLSEHCEAIAKVVLHNAPKNHQTTCPRIQKDLIKCCALETTKLIIEDLNGDLFGILDDESSDVSHKEELALCLRYVDKKGKVCERFLGILHVGNTTSQTLLAGIKQLLDDHSLSMSNIRGQGYDGASNMRGSINGLKNLIMRNTPCAYFIHCFAHQLQLTLVAVAKENTDCAKFFEHLGVVLNLIGYSCKRMEMVREIQAENVLKALELGEIKRGKGKNQQLGLCRPGETRWGSYSKSILNLIALYPTIISVLERVDTEAKTGTDHAKAQIAIDHLESFDFIFMLHLLKLVFGYTNVLCNALQRKDQDIVNAMAIVSVTKETLQDKRDHGWDEFFQGVCDFCVKHKIAVPNMSDSYAPPGRSTRRLGKVTNIHRYRVEMFLSIIDLQLQELNNRFSEASMELLLCMACLSPINSFASFNKQKLLRLAEFYPNEFTSIDRMNLEFELDIFVGHMRKDSRFQSIKSLSELSLMLVETNKHNSYPLVYLLIKLVLILPVATASVERVFSSMKYVKNNLRNSMGDKLLNHCLVTYVERDLFQQVKDDDVIKRFQNLDPRRLALNFS